MHIPFVPKVKFKVLAQFPPGQLAHPVVTTFSSLIHFFYVIYRICLLFDWSFRFYHNIIYISYLVASLLFSIRHWPYGIVLCCNKKRFSFFLKVFRHDQAFLREISLKTRNLDSEYMHYVGYHLAFQHNERFHLPYMAVAEISLGRISQRVRPEEQFLLLKYIITLSLILCSYY